MHSPEDIRTAIAHIRKVDRRMANLIERAGPFAPVKHTGTVYQCLIRSVVYQQLSGKAAAAIMARLLALASPTKHGFPKPEAFLALSIEELRQAGLSRAKAAYLKEVCLAAVGGILPSPKRIKSMDDEEIIAALTTIKGIGRWSVEMLLMFNLGRLDVLPATDYGVRKGFAKVYGWEELPSPKELLNFGERWQPYRTVPSWYLWRALELN